MDLNLLQFSYNPNISLYLLQRCVSSLFHLQSTSVQCNVATYANCYKTWVSFADCWRFRPTPLSCVDPHTIKRGVFIIRVIIMWHVWKHVCYYIDPKFTEFLFISCCLVIRSVSFHFFFHLKSSMVDKKRRKGR